jgi:PucR-like helix-turn-helix protein/diguanylate cyclase with GGDEF domain
MEVLTGGPPAADAEVRRVMGRLELREESLAREMLEAILAEIGPYGRSGGAALAGDVLEHCRSHVALLLRVLDGRRDPRRDELEFAREAAARRVHQGIPLDGLLQAFRVGHRTLWQTIVEEAGEDPAGREAAIALAGVAMDYIDVASTHVAEAYIRESGRLAERVMRRQRDLLENLLAGRPPADQAETRALAPGLDPEAELLVAVASIDDGGDDQAVRHAADALQARAGSGSLVVPRQGEVVALLPAGRGAAAVGEALHSARESAENEHGIRILVGVGGVSRGLGEVGLRYQEAHQGLRRASAERPIVALAELSPFERLVATADPGALRSIGEEARALLDSAPGRERLIDTVRAYLDADLDVKRTAEALFVHPNTVRYRLRRVTELTGFDAQRFSGLVELLTLARLAEDETAS